MSPNLPPLLIVDDEKNMRASLETVMLDEGYATETVESAEEALNRIEANEYFMVISDARLGGMSGYEFLKISKEKRPSLPILLITAYATPKLAVDTIKAGAIDYLAKPFAPEELLHAVGRCAETHRLRQENEALKKKAGEIATLDSILGESKKMRDIRDLISQVAPTHATVLILGESGTGKELIAGAIHSLSERVDGNYIRINCAAIPENLLESELFGHEKGAFTGALKQKRGRVEEADGGTIFLDEIGDMSRPLQAKLLRFLEDGSFTRVGGIQELRVDVRVIAATNRDIVDAIEKNEFREDLFHRLNVVQFFPPPLRERDQDVLILADFFLRFFSAKMNKPVDGLTDNANRKLSQHHWPGNIRELRNVIERALILETEGQIQASSLPDFLVEGRLKKTPLESQPFTGNLDDSLANYEREFIETVLTRHNDNVTHAAEELGLSRHALRYRMQRLHIGDSVKPEKASSD